MTHVFIVNDTTFKIHLEYMFAGTGASKDAPFLLDSNYVNPKRSSDGLTASGERNLVGMIADISRIRVGDDIVFYLQAGNKHPGMFFGFFKAKEIAFYKPNSDTYLDSELDKRLNFRIIIEPKQVFSKGVTEHDYLDRINDINHPSEMCWSLIYRKLKGNRGCTMITDYEALKLQKLLAEKNNNELLNGSHFTYSSNERCIVLDNGNHSYSGEKMPIDISSRLKYKYLNRYAYETHLQAYLMQNYDKSPIKELLLEKCVWSGNEVSCGVGMQRIDSLFISENNESIIIKLVELKCVEPYEEIVSDQLPWYVEWIIDYLVPTYKKKVVITPIIIAPAFSNEKDLHVYKELCDSFETKNNSKYQIEKIHYISLCISDDNISFKKEF